MLSIFDYYDGPLSGEIEWEGDRCYYLWLGEQTPRSYGVWKLTDAEWALVEHDRKENSQESAVLCGSLHDELHSRGPLARFTDEEVQWPPIPWNEL